VSLFETGVRPAIDQYLLDKSKEVRDYGDYWSASSAGYCMRKSIFERLKVPYVREDARKQRVFEVGHIFHGWVQEITKNAGMSVAQEIELQDEKLMVRGHIDDIVKIDGKYMLYDYKTQNSRAFSYKRPEMSYFHKMQLGTYLYMLEGSKYEVKEARICKISKDDLRMSEEQLMYTPELEKEVLDYWTELNTRWESKLMPACTCADREGGFMSREQYNGFFYNGKPCSIDWYKKWKSEQEKKLMEHDSSDRFKA